MRASGSHTALTKRDALSANDNGTATPVEKAA